MVFVVVEAAHADVQRAGHVDQINAAAQLVVQHVDGVGEEQIGPLEELDEIRQCLEVCQLLDGVEWLAPPEAADCAKRPRDQPGGLLDVGAGERTRAREGVQLGVAHALVRLGRQRLEDAAEKADP